MQPYKSTSFLEILKIIIVLSGILIVFNGCKNHPSNLQHRQNAPNNIENQVFEECAEKRGIHFTLSNGQRGKNRFVEFSSGGCALFDYDNDGWLDILLIQAGSSEPYTTVKNRLHCALYHNNGDGTFKEVTNGSGLDIDLGYAEGVAIGDYDNDGYDDIFITSFQKNYLFHSEHGSGKFTDVTHVMGLDKPHSTGYATSAAFGDYDNDGKLDLYICYYADWTWGKDGGQYTNLHNPDTHMLYHNDGSYFTDVSERAGISKVKGRGLAVGFLDYDGDGRQDIFVANDRTPNMLWHNNGDGTFTDSAQKAGCAFSRGGQLMGAMCAAIADYNHSGFESIYVTNTSGSPNTLFKNMGNGLFEDATSSMSSFSEFKRHFSFGGEFLDYDADGWDDLVLANGLVGDEILVRNAGGTPAQTKQLFHNQQDGQFQEIKGSALGPLNIPGISRGLAVGDFDNDGRLDVLVNNQNSPAQLFRNIDPSNNHWISFKTVGTKSNRDGLHTKFTISYGAAKQSATVRSGSSYMSVSDRRVYFGLGKSDKIDQVEIKWPSGTVDILRSIKPDTSYIVKEGSGITGSLPRF